jgi:flagellar basal-body rod protein FlgB
MAMFESINFKAAEASLQALSMKQQVIMQNLANQDTPDYKQAEFKFSNVLEDAENRLDVTKADGEEYSFQAGVYTNTERNILFDGNSVDTDEQSLLLYETYLQHSALIEKINGEFSKYSKIVSTQF